MNKFFFLFILLLFSGVSFAGVSQKDCPNADNTKNFGPVRDQDGIGYCWAFATASLVEEDLCISKGKNCDHKPISPIDVSHCNFTLSDIGDQGASFEAGINCVASDGVCYEEHAPIPDAKSLKCSLFDFLGKATECSVESLISIYDSFMSETKSLNICQKQSPSVVNKSPFIDTVKILTKILPDKAYSRNSFEEILIKYAQKEKSKENLKNFISDILIPKKCKDNRIKIKTKPSGIGFKGYDSNKKISFLAERLKSGRSLLIAACAYQHPDMKSIFNVLKSDQCGGHALIVNAMRWNAQKNKCEVHIRNSWGKNSKISGWSDVEDLAPATLGAIYYN